MTQIMHLQSNFTMGEIDERLHSRVDLEIFNKGAKRARNVLVLPQGGLRRRFGTSYVGTLSIATAASECRIAMFEFMDETKYLLLFEHQSLKIYHEDALVATVVSPYTKTQLPTLKFTQSHNNFITVHASVAPYVLKRVTAHGSWTFGAIAFTYYPTTDFDHNYDGATFTPSATSGTVTVTVTVATIVKATHVNGLFIANEGTMRITSVNVGAQTFVGFTITSFKDTTAVSGKLCVLTEPIWSDLLGWPKATTFFQGRLCFAGTANLPHGIWMSITNDFTDFNDSEALATSAMSIYINTNNSNIVEDIVGEKSFLIFTSTGLVSTQMLEDAPLTQLNAAFNLQNNDGIGTLRPVIFDNKVIYVDRGGKIVWGVDYDVQKGGHMSHDLSILSQPLIKWPTDIIVYRNPDIDNGNYLFLVNNDGTLAVLQSIEEQNVLGWTLQSTDGYFRHIAASENDLYFIVERTINSVKKFHIEKLDFNIELDCAYLHTYGAPTTLITGLTYLAGKTVQIFGDGKLQPTKVVDVGGQITLTTAATIVEIGLNYTPTVIPLPTHVATQTGDDLYLAKRIKTFWIDYYESLAIYVDDQLIPFIKLDETLLDAAPELRTGFYAITPMHGWEPYAEITITQVEPYPMTIRGIGSEIEVT